MYFDLDFWMQSLNSDANLVVKQFVAIVRRYCTIYLGLNPSEDSVIVLNSSKGFNKSFHLVFTSVVFENNTCCKQFVDKLLSRLSSIELDQMSYIDVNNCKKIIVDRKVYSQNQTFRKLYSSKYGRNTPFETLSMEEFTNIESFFYDYCQCSDDNGLGQVKSTEFYLYGH